MTETTATAPLLAAAGAASKGSTLANKLIDPAELEKVPTPPGSNDAGAGVRATRRQVSVVAEAESDAGEDSGDSAEGAGQEVVEIVESQLASDEGRKELASEIDGLEPNERNRREARAMDKTMEKLEHSKELDIEVVTSGPGENETVVTKDGERLQVNLRPNEKSRMVETADGSKVLVLSEKMGKAEAVKEASKAVAEVIEEVAEESGVHVADNFIFAFSDRIPRDIHRQIFRTSVDYGRYLYHSMVL